MDVMIIIDRFAGDIAICEIEEGGHEHVSRAELPAKAREGSVLVWVEGKWALDLQAEQARRAKLLKLQEDLFE